MHNLCRFKINSRAPTKVQVTRSKYKDKIKIGKEGSNNDFLFKAESISKFGLNRVHITENFLQ